MVSYEVTHHHQYFSHERHISVPSGRSGQGDQCVRLQRATACSCCTRTKHGQRRAGRAARFGGTSVGRPSRKVLARSAAAMDG